MYKQYDERDFIRVRILSGLGVSTGEISRLLGIPRSTVRLWTMRDRPPRGVRPVNGFKPVDEEAYSYLLGAYLGDGTIFSTGPRTWRIGITLDAIYPEVINEVAGAIERAYPCARACRNQVPGAILVAASGVDWAAAFPQHGPGRKHNRTIELVDWQREITDRYPEALLRGLIHSDGCRCFNTFKTKLPSGRVAEYSYPRYFFSNLSTGIRAIFCEYCDLLGVRWTQSNPRNISVSHRKSVAILDEFIGPKT